MTGTVPDTLTLPLPDAFIEAVAARVAALLADHQPPSPAPVAYTIATLAAELDVSAKVVRGAIQRGELDATRRGARFLVSADAARAWATSSTRTPHLGRTSARSSRPTLQSAFSDLTTNGHRSTKEPQ